MSAQRRVVRCCPSALALVLAWLGCNETVELFEAREPPSAGGSGGIGGSGGDTGGDGGGIGLGGGSGCDELPIGEPCESSAECCTGLCAVDAALKRTCRPSTGCRGVDEPCEFSSQCCSLGCFRVGVEIQELRCTEKPMCTLAGLPCAEGASCCTGVCDGGACAPPKAGACVPAGELCDSDMQCCGRSCSVLDGDFRRCALAQACRVSGEQCGVDGDCCSGRCNPELGDVLRCQAGDACEQTDGKSCTAQAGEVCSDDSDCCTGACDPSSDGPRCAYLAGCRQDCELCTTGAACCSGTCEKDSDGTPRCSPAPAGACADVGSVCSGPTECCPDGPGGICGVASVGEAAKRCIVEEGAPRPDGDPCSLPSQCTGKMCLPDPQGMLRCSSDCRVAGQPCTTTADCCDAASTTCVYLDGKASCAELIK
jgi:hypothetical protein